MNKIAMIKICLKITLLVCCWLLPINVAANSLQHRLPRVKKSQADKLKIESQQSPDKTNTAPVECKGEITPVKIILKPRASINKDTGGTICVSGTVRLKVVFLASGEIGQISVIGGLPYGLSEDSITAARKIKFIPAKQCGVPITKAKTVEYSFGIY